MSEKLENDLPKEGLQKETEKPQKAEKIVVGSVEYLSEFLNRMHPHGEFKDDPELKHLLEKLSYEKQLSNVRGTVKVVQLKEAEPGLPISAHVIFHKVEVSSEISDKPIFEVPREDLTDALEKAYPEHSFQVVSTSLQGKHPSYYIKVNIDGLDRNVLLKIKKEEDIETLDASRLAGLMRDSLRVYTANT